MENPMIRLLNARLLIRQECGDELIRFAERIDKSQPQTSAIVGIKPTKNIGLKIAREIARAFDKHDGWLDIPHFQEWRDAGLWNPGPDDDPQFDSLRENRARYVDIGSGAPSIEILPVPVIAWASAGPVSDSGEPASPELAEDWLFTPSHKTGPRSFALRVLGDSMGSPYPSGPTYPHGTIIIVDPDRIATVGSRVIARRPGEEVTFKVYTEDGGRRLLKPLNPQYAIVEMTADYRICGVVTGRWTDD